MSGPHCATTHLILPSTQQHASMVTSPRVAVLVNLRMLPFSIQAPWLARNIEQVTIHCRVLSKSLTINLRTPD
jgi:hypothetical protein